MYRVPAVIGENPFLDSKERDIFQRFPKLCLRKTERKAIKMRTWIYFTLFVLFRRYKIESHLFSNRINVVYNEHKKRLSQMCRELSTLGM